MYNLDQKSHLENLRKTLKTIIASRLKCKPKKCKLFSTEIEYLGYIVSHSGLRMDPAKVDKILAWPFPTTGNDMLSFLGLCNFYRTLIRNFAEYADPLYKISKQDNII